MTIEDDDAIQMKNNEIQERSKILSSCLYDIIQKLFYKPVILKQRVFC